MIQSAYANIGLSQIRLGNYTQAIKECSKAIELNYRHANAYNVRGLAYAEMKNYSKAITDLNTAIDIDPKLGNADTNLGI